MTAAAALVAAAVLAAGLALILLRSAPIEDAAPLASYHRTDDPRQIVIDAFLRQGESVARTDVDEDSSQVRITVRLNIPAGALSNVGIRQSIRVPLREPLGDRRVVDHLGRVLPEQGAGP